MAGAAFPPNFYFYLASRFCTATAMTMLRATIAWHVFALSHSAFHLGLVGLVQFLPALALSLFAGAVADAYDRRTVMLVAGIVVASCAAVLFVETWHDTLTLALLYPLIACVAAAAAFDNPSRAALLPSLVSREVFPRAVTVASTNQALAFVTGPALCGMLIAQFSVASVYLAYFGLVSVALICLACIHARPQAASGRAVHLRAIHEGLRFVRRQQVILGCMTLDMFAVIFGGASALLPIYANEILHVGAWGYGMLAASLDLGALLMSVALLACPPVLRAGRALLIGVAVYGLATILFGVSRHFPLSVFAYMLAGAADQVSVVMRSTAIQLSTPDALRGRVSSINMIFIGASNQLGAVESGFVAALTNATVSVVSGGVGCLLVLALVTLTMPQLRRYRIEFGTHRR